MHYPIMRLHKREIFQINELQRKTKSGFSAPLRRFSSKNYFHGFENKGFRKKFWFIFRFSLMKEWKMPNVGKTAKNLTKKNVGGVIFFASPSQKWKYTNSNHSHRYWSMGTCVVQWLAWFLRSISVCLFNLCWFEALLRLLKSRSDIEWF